MSTNTIKHQRSFLKWAGCKFTSLNRILSVLPKGNRLIEPFAGSGTVFINTNYPQYLIAETNHDVIDLFNCIKQEGETFIAYCKSFFTDANNTSEHYYQLREQFNQSSEPRQRAALFLYLNRHGYNGLCRYNQQGTYNVPFGRYVHPSFPDDAIRHFQSKCQQAEFKPLDFQDTFRLAQPGDVIYCDPPYVPINQQSNFNAYGRIKFRKTEQEILAQLATESAQRGIPVIISNHDTDFSRDLYQNSTITSFAVHRVISQDTQQRNKVQELIAVFEQ